MNQPKKVVLNSDDEAVLLEGLTSFAIQIRREHGLSSTHEKEDEGGQGRTGEAARREAGAAATTVEAEMAAAMDVDDGAAGGGGDSDVAPKSSSGAADSEDDEGGAESEAEGHGGDGGGGTGGAGVGLDGGRGDALLEAAATKGEAAGLLGEYLRGSPQLNDLLRLWDMDERKVRNILENYKTIAVLCDVCALRRMSTHGN